MVIDHYTPKFPADGIWRDTTGEPVDWSKVKQAVQVAGLDVGTPISTSHEWERAVADLRTLIDEFRRALEAAKTVDLLTGQPDCVDPEKAKLEERVARLEAELERYRGGAVY
jgi:hypothetical protein